MGIDLAFTLGILLLVFGALVMDVLSPDAVLLGGLVALVLGGVVELDQALQGFANSTLLALGSLYVVAAGLQEAGALDIASQYVLGEERNVRRLLLRMCPSVTTYSAFLNNTPVVAMGIPAIRGWCSRHGISPSKLLMPLAFAAVLGGICTLVGTSTNLVTHGLLQAEGLRGFGFFELAWVGLPCAAVGLVYVIFVAPSLLPARADIRDEEEAERAALVEVEVAMDSPLVGTTVDEAQLNLLPGLTLVRIQRGAEGIAPVGLDETLQPGDRLLFAPSGMEAPPTVESAKTTGAEGDLPETIRNAEQMEAVPRPELGLRAFPGLRLAYADISREEEREQHQVVVREGSSFIGERVDTIPFRERFGAALTGLRRDGERLEPPFDAVRLRPGDVLLLDTQQGFRGAYERSPEFFVTSEAGGEENKTAREAQAQREDMRPQRGGRSLWLAVAVLVGVVALVGTGALHIAVAGPLGAIVLVAAGVLTPGEARKAVDWSVLLVIGAALGIGEAMEASGAARMIGEGIVEVAAGWGPRGLLAGLILATAVLTNIVTNNGAVALMFPVALSVVESQGLAVRPFLVAMTLAASMAFSTPIGYQANLMVYGPGNYRFLDFVRVGGLLQLLLWGVLIVVTPLVWPL